MANITTSLTNAEYRSQRGYAKSDLDLIHKSPALLEWKKNAPREESEVAITGTALHAAVLGFVHPITGETIRCESPLPPDMAALEASLARL